MVMPRFAQVRRAIGMRDALVISCWLAGNAFLLISFLGLPSDGSGAGVLFAWIVLLAFSLLWLVEAACDQAGHSRAEQAGCTIERRRVEQHATVILMDALKRSIEAEGAAKRPAAKSKTRTAGPRKQPARTRRT
jgi:hypothetical protein